MKDIYKELLTKPYCGQLTENNINRHISDRCSWESIKKLANRYSNISDIVNTAFDWSMTPQGHNYWYDIKNE